MLRAIARSVFVPVPNVDSVLITTERVGAAAPPALASFVRAAFAHRRKALARSLSLSIGADRERVREVLVAQGHAPDVRAEALSPLALRAVWEAL